MDTLLSALPVLLLGLIFLGLLAWGLTRVMRLIDQDGDAAPMRHLTADDMRLASDELTAR